MSRSKLRSQWMRNKFDSDEHNPHKYDEMPKNSVPKHINMRCDMSTVAWLQESGSFGGHKVRHAGHRMVSGIVRQKMREELREEIANELDPKSKE